MRKIKASRLILNHCFFQYNFYILENAHQLLFQTGTANSKHCNVQSINQDIQAGVVDEDSESVQQMLHTRGRMRIVFSAHPPLSTGSYFKGNVSGHWSSSLFCLRKAGPSPSTLDKDSNSGLLPSITHNPSQIILI